MQRLLTVAALTALVAGSVTAQIRRPDIVPTITSPAHQFTLPFNTDVSLVVALKNIGDQNADGIVKYQIWLSENNAVIDGGDTQLSPKTGQGPFETNLGGAGFIAPNGSWSFTTKIFRSPANPSPAKKCWLIFRFDPAETGLPFGRLREKEISSTNSNEVDNNDDAREAFCVDNVPDIDYLAQIEVLGLPTGSNKCKSGDKLTIKIRVRNIGTVASATPTEVRFQARHSTANTVSTPFLNPQVGSSSVRGKGESITVPPLAAAAQPGDIYDVPPFDYIVPACIPDGVLSFNAIADYLSQLAERDKANNVSGNQTLGIDPSCPTLGRPDIAFLSNPTLSPSSCASLGTRIARITVANFGGADITNADLCLFARANNIPDLNVNDLLLARGQVSIAKAPCWASSEALLRTSTTATFSSFYIPTCFRLTPNRFYYRVQAKDITGPPVSTAAEITTANNWSGTSLRTSCNRPSTPVCGERDIEFVPRAATTMGVPNSQLVSTANLTFGVAGADTVKIKILGQRGRTACSGTVNDKSDRYYLAVFSLQAPFVVDVATDFSLSLTNGMFFKAAFGELTTPNLDAEACFQLPMRLIQPATVRVHAAFWKDNWVFSSFQNHTGLTLNLQ